MKLSLDYLTNHLLDYAGLFPPAQLPLDTALQNYFFYLNHPYKAALGKFILPASKCRECVSSHGLTAGSSNTISFSILCSQAKSIETIHDSFQTDLSNVTYFINNTPKQCQIDSYEILFPQEFYMSDDAKILGMFESLGAANQVFCEMPFLLPETIMHFLSVVARYNASSMKNKVFIKLRTGGIKPEHVPSIQTLANAIISLAKFRIPFKVTAGLHVPIPNFNASVGAKMHGFLNVIFASIFAFQNGVHSDFDMSRVANILENLGYENLHFHENGIVLNMQPSSNGATAILFSNEMIKNFREQYFRGIGSCDFLEPLEHLKHNYPNAWE